MRRRYIIALIAGAILGWAIYNSVLICREIPVAARLDDERCVLEYNPDSIIGSLHIYKYIRAVTFRRPLSDPALLDALLRLPELKYVDFFSSIDRSPYRAQLDRLRSVGIIVRQ